MASLTRSAGASSSSRSLLSLLLVALLSALALAPSSARAQSDFTAIGNKTALYGTWSSGSGHVKTGLDFYNPITKTFNVPKSAGISYSFTDDGHFETAQFTWTSNPVTNRCFKAVLIWQHGNFTFNANNSLSLFPFAPDGMVQIMDPCAAQSVSQYPYNEFELIPKWFTFQENHPGFLPAGRSAWALQMYTVGPDAAAGAPKSPMLLTNRPPTMLPTTQLFQQQLNDLGEPISTSSAA